MLPKSEVYKYTDVHVRLGKLLLHFVHLLYVDFYSLAISSVSPKGAKVSYTPIAVYEISLKTQAKCRAPKSKNLGARNET